MANRLGVAAAVVAILLLGGCAITDADNTGATPSPSSSLKYGSAYHLPTEFREWEELYQRQLDKLASEQQVAGLGAPPTDVMFVRFLRPDEYASVTVECLHKQGFDRAAETFDGGVEYGKYPSDQSPALVAAIFRCEVQFPVHPQFNQPLTADKVRITYDYYVSELVPCLTREGYPADVSKIPTLETFQATYGRDGMWFPYDVVLEKQRQLAGANGGVIPADWSVEWERVNTACPQSVPLDRLWPDA